MVQPLSYARRSYLFHVRNVTPNPITLPRVPRLHMNRASMRLDRINLPSPSRLELKITHTFSRDIRPHPMKNPAEVV